MWRAGTVVALHDETATARTITVEVSDWPGHVAGQHVDVRLTASDGYSAVRSYSIASAPNSERRVELTVERLPKGEVSPYLTQEVAVSDRLELRGPIGGWFVWLDLPRPAGRIDAGLIANATWPSNLAPTCYVCGPTPFVESVANFLSASGNSPNKIRTERFGPTGDRK
jgi:ferredoxin-NADP reductase